MIKWIALESNPEVLTKYIHNVGVSPLWSITDVFGLEPEVLDWLPKPVKAFILLSPCSDKLEKIAKDRDAQLQANPPIVPKELFFMKQYVRNACGAIALVHAIANVPEIEIEAGSVLKKFLTSGADLSYEERGRLLQNDESFTSTHESLAAEGQTDASTEPVEHHFLALVEFKNRLYELDGRNTYPIDHGPTTSETFAQDAAKICKAVMEQEPDDVRFSVVALTPTQ